MIADRWWVIIFKMIADRWCGDTWLCTIDADDVEDADDVYSVEWVRSYLESNPVWLFNAELLSKIEKKASEHVSIRSLLLPISSCNKIYRQYVYIPTDEELKSILKWYEM